MSKRKEKTADPAPNSSMTTRRSMDTKMKLRSYLAGYKKLEDEGASTEEKISYTSKVIDQANELLAQGSMEERVRHPVENYLASRVLRATAEMTAACAAAAGGALDTYDRRELALHIKENPVFWALQFPLAAPAQCSLHGAFDAAPRPRARAAPRAAQRQAAAEKTAPANVDKLERQEEGAEMVSRVRRFLSREHARAGAALSYLHVVLDPASFARTVENVYHLSFLVREGAIALTIDEESGMPVVTPQEAEGGAGEAEGGDNQFIVSLDMARWQELVKVLRIDKPMMVLKR